jgi:poly-gamma-glutamate capsule biosynthesis protein CapA/YwtB (metallophosphatase superfamily)
VLPKIINRRNYSMERKSIQSTDTMAERDSMNQNRGWKVAIAGECMLSRTFAMHSEPEFLKIREIMHGADVTYAHLEMNFGDFSTTGWPARGDWVGSYMLADPAIAKDLRWLGIDVMSLANNHSYDFGAPGLLETIKHCREAGITCSGTGRDLEEAREPGYWEGAAGRVAVVSTTSGNGPHEWANLPKGTIPARPGVNPLRVRTRYRLPAEDAEKLRRIGRELDVLRMKGNSVEGGTVVGMNEGEFRIVMPGDQSSRGSGVFCEGEEFGIETECNKRDFEGNLRSIKEGRNMADFVMVAHHFNISEGPRGDVPTAFAREFAHAAIDSGADVYYGHGWHKTLGIEIYKGKPIFYGLGNFFAQSQFIRRVPFDSYETWEHDMNQLSTLNPSDEPLHPGLDRPSETWWSSALIEAEFNSDGHVQSMTLYPVEMGREVSMDVKVTHGTGHGRTKHAEGRPRIATGQNARRILERLRDLSEQYGTVIEIDGDVGRWNA